MTQEELIKEIKQLPLDQQKEIAEKIRADVAQPPPLEKRKGITSRLGERTSGAANTLTSGNGKSALSQTLYGILQFENGPPTDQEVKDMLADYLIKKYY